MVELTLASLIELMILGLGALSFFFFKNLVGEVKNLRIEMHNLNLKLERYFISLDSLEKRVGIIESRFNSKGSYKKKQQQTGGNLWLPSKKSKEAK